MLPCGQDSFERAKKRQVGAMCHTIWSCGGGGSQLLRHRATTSTQHLQRRGGMARHGREGTSGGRTFRAAGAPEAHKDNTGRGGGGGGPRDGPSSVTTSCKDALLGRGTWRAPTPPDVVYPKFSVGQTPPIPSLRTVLEVSACTTSKSHTHSHNQKQSKSG